MAAGCKESCTQNGQKRCQIGTPASTQTCNGVYWQDPVPCALGKDYCDPNNNCVACLTDPHCTGPTNKYCVGYSCVQCKTNNDCGGSTPVCVNNACIAGCLKASDCGTNPCKTYACSATGACSDTNVAAATPCSPTGGGSGLCNGAGTCVAAELLAA